MSANQTDAPYSPLCNGRFGIRQTRTPLFAPRRVYPWGCIRVLVPTIGVPLASVMTTPPTGGSSSNGDTNEIRTSKTPSWSAASLSVTPSILGDVSLSSGIELFCDEFFRYTEIAA